VEQDENQEISEEISRNGEGRPSVGAVAR